MPAIRSVPTTRAANGYGPRAGVPGIPVPVSEFGWPLQPVPAVSRPFQPPSRPYGPGHRGADLVGTEGRPVLSAGAWTAFAVIAAANLWLLRDLVS